MYVPSHFQQANEAEITSFMRRQIFATVVTHDGVAPFATHVPMLLHPHQGPKGTLVAHLAKANPQWRHFSEEKEVLVIFSGPHAYVSPSMYETSPAVPTWNYATVHAYGVPKVVTDPEKLVAMLAELVATHEAGRENPWSGELTPEYRDRMIAGIVGFEIEITRVEAKYKLSQNRPEADVRGVVAALSASVDQTDRELAAMMERISLPQ